jgi:hypothetical protein
LNAELPAINNNIVVGGQSSEWQTNMVAWAAAEEGAILANPNMDSATKANLIKDIQDRLTAAYNDWLRLGGPPSETPGTGNMPTGSYQPLPTPGLNGPQPA